MTTLLLTAKVATTSSIFAKLYQVKVFGKRRSIDGRSCGKREKGDKADEKDTARNHDV